MRKITTILLLFIFLASCGTTGIKQSNIPFKCEHGFCSVGGESSGNESKEKALDSAEINAFGRIARHFGVKINSSSRVIREKKNGKYSAEIKYDEHVTGKTIKIKYWNYKEPPYIEQKGSKYNAYVIIEIPEEEYERIRTEIEALEEINNIKSGNAVWALKSDIPECENKIRNFFPVFRQKRVTILVDKKVNFDNTIDEVATEFHDKVRYLLKIECDEEGNEPDPYGKRTFYSYITLKVELLDLSNKNVINRWSVTKKGAMLGLEAARKHGIEQAVNAIIAQIQD